MVGREVADDGDLRRARRVVPHGVPGPDAEVLPLPGGDEELRIAHTEQPPKRERDYRPDDGSATPSTDHQIERVARFKVSSPPPLPVSQVTHTFRGLPSAPINREIEE